MKALISLVAILAVSGCGQPTPPPEQAVAPVASAPEAPAVQSEAAARAEALIEDMQRKESALAKFERENPAPPPPRLDDILAAQRAATQPPAAVAVAPSGPSPDSPAAPAPTTAAATTARDESWWKNGYHDRELKYQDSLAKANAAGASMRTTTSLYNSTENARLAATAQSGFQSAEAEYQKAVRQADIDRAELDRFREDARRANVPPGWLRWP